MTMVRPGCRSAIVGDVPQVVRKDGHDVEGQADDGEERKTRAHVGTQEPVLVRHRGG